MKKGVLFLFLLATVFAGAQTGNIIIPNGHSLKIEKVIVDRQGKYVYSVENEKAIMWDFKTQAQLYTFPLAFDKIADVAISDDGTLLGINSEKKTKVFSTVSGKEIYSKEGYGRHSISFSADGKKIYTSQAGYGKPNGIVETDLASRTEKYLVQCDGSKPDCGFQKAVRIGADEFLTYTRDGWLVWNESTGGETYRHDLKIPTEGGFGAKVYHNMQVLPAQGWLLLWMDRKLRFYDARNGKLLKTMDINNSEYLLFPSDDKKYFGLGQFYNREESDVYVYNATTFEREKTVDMRGSAVMPGEGVYLSARSEFLVSHYSDLYLVNNKARETGKFHREVANLGSNTMNALDYNRKTSTLNMMVDDSFYKSIDLSRLVPYRHKKLPVHIEDVYFSAAGDTVSIYDETKGFMYDAKKGLRIKPLVTVAGKPGFNSRASYFFSRDGLHTYHYTSAPLGKDRFTLTIIKTAIKTGVQQKTVSYPSSDGTKEFLDLDKEVLISYVDGQPQGTLTVYSLATGKTILTKKVDAAVYGNGQLRHAVITDDRNRVVTLAAYTINVIDIATGEQKSAQPKVGAGSDFPLYTISNDGKLGFILESSGRISAFDTDGATRYQMQAHNNDIRTLLFSPDNRHMFSISSDQSIKVWQTGTGKLLGTLYLFNDGNDYVFLDPDGRFDGTPEGIRRMYYYKNRNKVALDVVYEKFYTPNLYLRLLTGETFSPIDFDLKPAPKVKMGYAAITRNLEVEDARPAYTNNTGAAEITVTATAPDDKVDEIRLFHNGKIVTLTARNLIVEEGGEQGVTKKYSLALLPGNNTVRAVALNSQRTESDPDEMDIMYAAGGGAPAPKPATGVRGTTAIVATVDRAATLHLVVVGINQYANPAMSLNYALADATAFKTQLEANVRSMTENVKTYFVTDAAANKDGISKAFAAVQAAAKPEDVFVFYYAGHGVIGKDKEFYLVPNDVSDLQNVQSELAQKGIAANRLQQYAIDIKAQKQLFILDACQSAGAFEKLLSADGDQQKNIALVARSTGTHWMAASGSQQFANEFSALGHGAFTYVLLEALKGKATQNKMVTVNGLKAFLQAGVPELMRKYNGAAQYPVSYGAGADFPLEVKR